MITISISEIFKDDEKLLNTLLGFINIPIPEVRNDLVKAFCNHPQMKSLLDKHNLLPDYFYVMLMMQL